MQVLSPINLNGSFWGFPISSIVDTGQTDRRTGCNVFIARYKYDNSRPACHKNPLPYRNVTPANKNSSASNAPEFSRHQYLTCRLKIIVRILPASMDCWRRPVGNWQLANYKASLAYTGKAVIVERLICMTYRRFSRWPAAYCCCSSSAGDVTAASTEHHLVMTLRPTIALWWRLVFPI